MPNEKEYKKVLVIGSGPIVIGQAAEFDYAGTQACMALKEEGIEIVLANNNPATIMTDDEIADFVYFEPLTTDFLEKIIEREEPDAVLAMMGGQTGLNLAIELQKRGVFEKWSVDVLGTPIEGIQKGEDRELFKQTMAAINEPVPDSITTSNVEKSLDFAELIGYPVIVRPAYTLGGSGGGKAENKEELIEIATRGIKESPIGQIQVDKSLYGWKEIEYEVMRDQDGNSIVVCNMENIDPIGIHTGDSFVVAPSQTLTDREYQMLRSVSLKVIDALGIIGGCNIQFALDPYSEQYYIIEVNPRVSRSSALASKATGYPIASIATKLALGYKLYEIKNPITKNTYASFEPTLDYVVLKMPKWPFDKFPYINRSLGTQMKATGEIMTIDRTFERAFYKGIRALEMNRYGLIDNNYEDWSNKEIKEGISKTDDRRLFFIGEALNRGMTVEIIHKLSYINTFYLTKFRKMVEMEKEISSLSLENLTVINLKKYINFGISIQLIAKLLGSSFDVIWKKLENLNISPVYKSVDTCAGEFEAVTPYFYSTTIGYDDRTELNGKKIAVIGSGPIRIGQGIEFDYCSVQTSIALKEEGTHSIIINNNPETVSTDYHMSSRLYMEPLNVEDVLPILLKEKVDGVIYQVGGQTALRLAKMISPYIPLLGTPIDVVDAMEDRELFNQFLFKAGIEPIPGKTIKGKNDLRKAIEDIGFPLVIRPSYVIGGQWMRIIHDETDLNRYIKELIESLDDQTIYPLLVEKYIVGKEIELDAVSDGTDFIVPTIVEHIEPAGVHSGDSTAILPAYSLTKRERNRVIDMVKKILDNGSFVGLVNIQIILEGRKLYALEVNPRASRTVPIISKVTGVPLIKLATMVQMGKRLKDLSVSLGVLPDIPFCAVKAPVFSNKKLPGVTDVLGPEMKSTGEILSLGWSLAEALEKIKDATSKEYMVPRTLREYRQAYYFNSGRIPTS